jgi:hypothetical protein
MVMPDGGAVAVAVTVADVVGRVVLGCGEAGCVLGLVRAGVVEGDTGPVDAAPGPAQLGGAAAEDGADEGEGAGLAAGERAGSGELCAAGESGPPEVTAG